MRKKYQLFVFALPSELRFRMCGQCCPRWHQIGARRARRREGEQN